MGFERRKTACLFLGAGLGDVFGVDLCEHGAKAIQTIKINWETLTLQKE